MKTRLYQRYMVPLSYLDIYRARQELQLIKSIHTTLRKAKYVLRFTDKSGIFHLGHATDYEKKAKAYQQKTGAYIELESDPLWPVFDKVVHLLNNLRSKRPNSSMVTRENDTRNESRVVFSLFILLFPNLQ